MKNKAFTKIARQAGVTGRVTTACAVLLLLFTSHAQPAERQVLHGHVPAVVAQLLPVGSLPGTNRLNLAIGLPLRNQEALTDLLRQIYDPASPNYRHYLTPQQFTEQFGPTEKDYQAIIAFAKANGLTVTGTDPTRMLVDVNGSVTDIERALHMTLRTYRHPTENRTFYAPDTEPSLDLAVPVLSISCLDNYSLPRPRLQVTPLSNASKALPNAGSGPSGTYMGKDFRVAYVPDSSLNGSGQIVGLLQFDGYTASDITYYESKAGLPSITLSNVLVDGASGNPSGSGGEVEVSLDIEMAISMATNLSEVMVYMAPNGSPWEDLLNRMANDNLAKQLSCSWYAPGAGEDPTADQIFQKMAAQGQSFFNASGDYDAYTGLIPFPGDTPYLTQVGGTTLTTSGPGGSWVSETVWNWGGGIGSGGGVSTQYPIPSWQTNINMTANQGSITMRNTPDVALTADNVYVRADGSDYNVGGTSCAAPLWAGFAALVNQQAATSGKPAVGFINPAVDAIGSGVNYPSAFHDITTGNNTSGSSPTKFYAVSGYDLCTGWGTPAGQELINALVNPEALVINPGSGFASIGGIGGPFTITSQSLCLTNVGTNSLTWSLINTSLWLNASPGGGTLTPGGPAAKVTVSLNSTASNLVVGAYSATVWFTNLNDNVGQSRQFNLSVISPPTITQQPNDQAVLEGATATFMVGAAGGLPLYYQWQDNGTNLTDGSNVSGSTTTNLTISNASSANVGTYSVIVSNVANVATSSNAFLTITPSVPVIIMQPTNQAVVVGRTAQFNVVALGNKPFSYQWSFMGTNIVGATNNLLVLTNAQFSQAGNYAVLVTNLLGSALSSNAVLTVNAVPPCDPPPSGIVSWWPGEGNANDIVGSNNGVLENGLGFAPGEVGQAFFFNNANADVQVPAGTSLNVGAGSGFTVEAWINPSDVSQLHPLFEWNTGNGAFGVHFYISTDAGPGSFYANIVDNGGSWHQFHSSVAPLTTNVFQHVALTYDKPSGVATIYCNGAVVVQQTLGSFTPLTTYNLYLGRRPLTQGSTFSFSGLLDEPSLYNRALSSNEIAAIYNAGSGGKCPPTPTPPAITTQPINQTVYVGQTATFSVTASGTPPLSYQWNFDGTNISGATNTTLVLINVQLSQAGTYVVLVANLYGSTNSANALLTVNPLQSCDPPPSGIVSWWPGEGNANDIIGTNNGVLEGVIGFGTGKVGQAFLFNNTNADVRVPASTSLNVGAGSGFTVEAWINPSDVSQLHPLFEWNNGAGSWGAQLYIGTQAGPGSLTANIVDSGGTWHSIQTSIAPLTTNVFQHVALTYDKPSGVAAIYCNGAVVVQQTLGSFTPLTTYNLYLGRRPPGGSDTYTFAGLLDEPSLYNRALSSNEIAAIYNAGSGGKCPPTPPAITTQPINQTVYVGQTATFSMTASGTPPLSYRWNFDGTNISGATNTTLVLTNVQLSQAGTYVVLVTNLYGSTNSGNALLTVNPLQTCDPPPSGIVSWWPGEGNANDIVGTNNGTSVGGISYVNGEVGQAFQLDGMSGYIAIPASPSLNIGTGSGVTIEGWIMPNDPGQIAMPIVEWDSASSDGLQLWMESGLKLFANIRDTAGNGHTFYSATGLVSTNSFQHVALTYDKSSGAAFLYLNGVQVASTNLGSLTPQTTYPLNLGKRTTTGNLYNGLLDEISLYNRALSSNEIAAIYNAGSGGKCPPTPTPPAITTQPINQTVYVGQTATFSVTASGTPPLSYQWNFDGTNISGATNTTLVLINVQLSQAGTYAVLVTNLYGSTNSANALLTVDPLQSCDPPPSGIVSWWPGEGNANDIVGTNNGVLEGVIGFGAGEVGQAFLFNNTNADVRVPASTSLNVGAGSGFTVEAWINPSDVSQLHPLFEWNNGAGSWGAQLYISTDAGPGSFYANIVDSGGGWHQFHSSVAPLTTNVFQHVALTYDKPSGVAAIYCNGAVVVQQTLGSFTPLTTYNLYLGRRPPGGSDTYTFAGLLDEPSLYNRALSSNEIAAIYNAGSGGKCPPTPPAIITQPTNQTVVVGGTASFSMTASGTPPLSYQWNFDGTNISGATNTTLVLTNVQLSQAGTYVVLVTNLYGSTNSANALLTVNPPPPPVPVITGFSPISGFAGTTVAISGINFSPVASNNIVCFGAVRAVVTGASATNLAVTMPVGATYAPITETVNGLTAYADQPFLPTFPGFGQIDSSSLGSQVTLPTGNGPGRVLIADLDGDGKPDLIIADSYAGELSIYRNISTNGTLTAGSFAPRVVLPMIAGSYSNPYTVAVADLDGDGKLDIIALNADSDIVSIFRNISSPGSITTNSFAARIDLPAGNVMRGLAVRDMNGDGKPDIVTANWGDNTISIFQNMSTIGNIAFAPRVNFATGAGPTGLAIGDLDGDGNPDVAVANSAGSTVSVFRNLGAGGNITTNSLAPKVDFPAMASTVTIAIGDVDGDGKLDLVVGGGNGTQAISVYRNTATPGSITTNSFAPPVEFAAAGWVNDVTLGDINGDGKPDIALVSQLSSYFSIFQNVSTPGSFTNNSLAARADYAAGYNPNGVAVGDLDGDGRPDIVFCNSYNNTISIYQNIVPFGTAPVIVSQPQSQSVQPGCDATFNVFARGTMPLSYQWWKDGLALSGQTNMSLMLTNVQTSNFGGYSVVITNVFGSVTSSPAQLALGHSPVANADTICRFASGGVRVNVSELLANDTDADGNSLTVIEVNPSSAAGGTVGLTNNWVYYAPPGGSTNGDTFTYIVSDGHCGTDVGTVTVQIKADNPQPLTFAIANPGDGSSQLTFDGIPGYTYRIEYADDLSNPDWQTITTQTADGFGVCQFVDGSLTNTPARFYRAVWP